jgi:hypothetical protein
MHWNAAFMLPDPFPFPDPFLFLERLTLLQLLKKLGKHAAETRR